MPTSRFIRVSSSTTQSFRCRNISGHAADVLTYRWWQHEEADSAESEVAINDADAQQASFVVPSESGKQVHMILEVTDKGTPALSRYQRVVCSIE